MCGGGHGSRHPPRHLPVTSCTRCKGGCKTQPLLLPLLGLCEEETADNQGSGGVTCAVSCPDEMAAFFFLRGGGGRKKGFWRGDRDPPAGAELHGGWGWGGHRAGGCVAQGLLLLTRSRRGALLENGVRGKRWSCFLPASPIPFVPVGFFFVPALSRWGERASARLNTGSLRRGLASCPALPTRGFAGVGLCRAQQALLRTTPIPAGTVPAQIYPSALRMGDLIPPLAPPATQPPPSWLPMEPAAPKPWCLSWVHILCIILPKFDYTLARESSKPPVGTGLVPPVTGGGVWETGAFAEHRT